MLKKVTATVLILIGLITLSNILLEEFNPNNKWLKNTYSLKIDTLKAKIRIPKVFKDFNINTCYDLISKPVGHDLRSRLIGFKIQHPEVMILVDSINSKNQVHIYRQSIFIPITEEGRKQFIQAFVSNKEYLAYDLNVNILSSSIGSKDNFKFIKIKLGMLSTISDKGIFSTVYVISVYDYSFVIQVIAADDIDTDVFIRNLIVRKRTYKTLS